MPIRNPIDAVNSVLNRELYAEPMANRRGGNRFTSGLIGAVREGVPNTPRELASGPSGAIFRALMGLGRGWFGRRERGVESGSSESPAPLFSGGFEGSSGGFGRTRMPPVEGNEYSPNFEGPPSLSNYSSGSDSSSPAQRPERYFVPGRSLENGAGNALRDQYFRGRDQSGPGPGNPGALGPRQHVSGGDRARALVDSQNVDQTMAGYLARRLAQIGQNIEK